MIFCIVFENVLLQIAMSQLNGTIPKDTLELRPLTDDKRTRFQVNRVRSESQCAEKDLSGANLEISEDDQTDDDDLHSMNDRTRLNSEHVKSFR